MNYETMNAAEEHNRFKEDWLRSKSDQENRVVINTYEFGCAPQAVKDGYLPSVTIENGTLEGVLFKYEGQDVAVVYGPAVRGSENQFEFAILQRNPLMDKQVVEDIHKFEYAILTGSLINGFKISKIVTGDDVAEKAIIDLLANGVLADKLLIQLPSSLSGKKSHDSVAGDNFVAFSDGIGSGIELYGPFDDHEWANQFAESLGEDGDWAVFIFKPEIQEEITRMNTQEKQKEIFKNLGYTEEQIKALGKTGEGRSQVFSGFIGSLPASKEFQGLVKPAIPRG